MSLLVQNTFTSHLRRRKLSSVAAGFIAVAVILSLTVFILSIVPAYGATRQSKTDPLAKAKASVAQAKKEANQASASYASAYGALEKVNDELADTQSRLDAAAGNISSLQVKASVQAKDAYIRSSEEARKQNYEDIVDNSRRDQLLATVSEFDDKQLTTLVGMKEDLEIAREELTALQSDRRQVLNTLAEQKKALDTKLANATKAQKDLEAKMARDAKTRAAAAAAARKRSSTSAGTIINPGSGSMACPIQGSLAFTNDWGQPRSGGRTHKGNDLFSPRGTPNVAVVDGSVTFRNEGTGGLSAYLAGNNGITYYYTHLDSYVGGSRSVKRGEVIGKTGNTGNAKGGATHTHFEIRQGGTKVNPYATLRSVC